MRKYLLLGLIALFAAHGAAVAQQWPTKEPIHVIISNTPGSALDVTARIVFEQVGRQIGQTVVAENKPGAANVIGIAAVAKAAPDGYTVLVTTSGIAIAPFTHKSLPYDTLRDLRAVMPLGNLTNVMIVPAGRFKSLKDLVGQGKGKARRLAVRIDRSRQHRQSDRRAAGLKRRLQGDASAVQGHRRGCRRSWPPGASTFSLRRSPPRSASSASTKSRRWPSAVPAAPR